LNGALGTKKPFQWLLKIVGLANEIPEGAAGDVVEPVRVDLAAALAPGVVVRLVVSPPGKQVKETYFIISRYIEYYKAGKSNSNHCAIRY